MTGLDRPVRIQGAGPAGLSAAIVLARGGKRVEVYERNNCVGKRFRGDLHGVENWSQEIDCARELTSFGIDTSFEFDPCHNLDLSNGRRIKKMRFDRPLYYLVRRGNMPGCLDEGLVQQAQDLGVKILYDQALADADADIVAGGPNPAEVFAIEKGLLFETSAPDISSALVHPQWAGGGYAYLLVHRGRGVLCSVVFKDFDRIGASLKRSVDIFNRLYEIPMQSARPIGGIGSFSYERFTTNDGVCRTGEAAGLQDLLFGFGIRNAIVSGAIAAQSLLRGQDHFSAVQLRFDESMRHGLTGRRLWDRWTYPLYGPLVWAFSRNRDPHNLLIRMHRGNRLYTLITFINQLRGVRPGSLVSR